MHLVTGTVRNTVFRGLLVLRVLYRDPRWGNGEWEFVDPIVQVIPKCYFTYGISSTSKCNKATAWCATIVDHTKPLHSVSLQLTATTRTNFPVQSCQKFLRSLLLDSAWLSIWQYKSSIKWDSHSPTSSLDTTLYVILRMNTCRNASTCYSTGVPHVPLPILSVPYSSIVCNTTRNSTFGASCDDEISKLECQLIRSRASIRNHHAPYTYSPL